jgi:hypothetical protein
MIEGLFEQHNFDPTKPGQMLIGEHRDAGAAASEGYIIAPLVVVTEASGYRASQAVYDHDGNLQPSQSVTFDQARNVTAATTAFGGSADVLELSVKLMDEKIAAYYLGTQAEYHQT